MIDMQACMLTTLDNPYDPFTQFDDWYRYDEDNGYHSLEYLARVCESSDNLSEADQNLAIEAAIDEIISFNVTGNYQKKKKDIEVETFKSK